MPMLQHTAMAAMLLPRLLHLLLQTATVPPLQVSNLCWQYLLLFLKAQLQ